MSETSSSNSRGRGAMLSRSKSNDFDLLALSRKASLRRIHSDDDEIVVLATRRDSNGRGFLAGFMGNPFDSEEEDDLYPSFVPTRRGSIKRSRSNQLEEISTLRRRSSLKREESLKDMDMSIPSPMLSRRASLKRIPSATEMEGLDGNSRHSRRSSGRRPRPSFMEESLNEIHLFMDDDASRGSRASHRAMNGSVVVLHAVDKYSRRGNSINSSIKDGHLSSNEGVAVEELQNDDDDDEDDVPDLNPSSANEAHVRFKQNSVQRMTRRETRILRIWRIVVLLALLLVGGFLSIGTYLFLSKNQEQDYVQSYDLFVISIQDTLESRLKDMFEVLRALSDGITASALAANATFPFVTVPMFEVAGKHARTTSHLKVISYQPIISEENKEKWASYMRQNQGWLAFSNFIATGGTGASPQDFGTNVSISSTIFQRDGQDNTKDSPGPGPYAPVWQVSPPPSDPGLIINYNLYAEDYIAQMVDAISPSRDGVFSETQYFSRSPLITASFADNNRIGGENASNSDDGNGHLRSMYMQAVRDSLNAQKSKVAGFVVGILSWDDLFTNLLPEGVKGICAVLRNSCGQDFTYRVLGSTVSIMSEGDLHDSAFDVTERVVAIFPPERNETESSAGQCVYSIHTYSSSEFKGYSTGETPVVIATSVAITFAVMGLIFCLYDWFVQRRNSKVVRAAARSNAILASLFPATVRDRLFETEVEDPKTDNSPASGKREGLKSYLQSGDFSEVGEAVSDDDASEVFKTKPIADLIPETSVLFADIAGFTAWSSVREPSQVFTLLETLYHAFDEIAKRRCVFKVETVGDCYVAVTGLPEPQKDHAVIISRFARECMNKMHQLTKKLEVRLGPDTGDLSMRMGIHSGPVTAGVLRAERSRFQLFGDTMNTASRMESTGEKGKIQVSAETAELLIAAGKKDWIRKREDKVVAKGKGELQTFWLLLSRDRGEDGANHMSEQMTNEEASVGETAAPAMDIYEGKTARLIDWNVDVLLRLLKHIVARRKACPPRGNDNKPDESRYCDVGRPVIDEVKEIIVLPKFNALAAIEQERADNLELSLNVVEQLHDYVCNIAAIYQDNPFHNFEHASHVTMSVVKLLSRIVAPSEFDWADDTDDDDGKRSVASRSSTLHDHTFGITSDPLTQFACVFSALIHDVDHPGVPNTQLVKENSRLASNYKNKSIAEQNSVDLAWGLLMDGAYCDLRAAIYGTDSELRRFRQLVVNSVMSTDIVDKELKTLRNMRWDRAFSPHGRSLEMKREDVNRKATIVIEHLIQASDVAHTMQHWHIYRKWNERFFAECYGAFKQGRAEKDPAEYWYEGEIGFFDNYIIPLARKLKDCGVFGVSSDEYLNYAVRNRQEWLERGREVVDEMIENVTHQHASTYRALGSPRLTLPEPQHNPPPTSGVA